MTDNMVNVPERPWKWLKTMYLRITLTRITTIFFLSAFFSCFALGLVKAFLATFDAEADSLVSAILQDARVPQTNFAWLTRHHNIFTLQLCDAVPDGRNVSPCVTVFETGDGVENVPSGFRKRQDDALDSPPEDPSSTEDTVPGDSGAILPASPAGHFVSAFNGMAFIQPVLNSSSFDVIGVNLSMAGVNRGNPVVLDEQCTRVMVYADQVLRNSKREELTLISAEFWLFGISVFAILYESIPHLLAGLSLRLLSMAWSAYTIWRTNDIDTRFRVLITDGACGINLFPGYFPQRIAAQILDLVLNIMALLLFFYLVWRLAKVYSNFMFKRVGAPEHIVKVYRYFLCMFTCLQLSVFLLVSSTALWIDELFNGAIAKISSHTPLYMGLFLFTITVLIPWIIMGWFAVRREMLRTMVAFLLVGFTFLTCWAIMYNSLVYRWTWIQWPFFASLTVAAQLVLVASIILGVICWRNFDKGLAHYLHVNSVLEKSDFAPAVFQRKGDVEKRAAEKELYHLSLGLDFGARQPPLLLSPPLPVVTSDASANSTAPVADVAAGRITSMSELPAHYALPTLGKNDPWRDREAKHNSEDFGF